MTKVARKIFFLHIPKTAGSSLSRMFEPAFRGNFHEHMESNPEKFRKIADTKSSFFLSGHFRYKLVNDLVTAEDVFSITIIREPVEQLISHLKWVKAYAAPESRDRAKSLSDPVRELAENLWRTNLNDIDAVENAISCDQGMRFFDNCHTRYLANVFGPVTKDHQALALKHLKKFNLFCTVEQLPEARNRLVEIAPRLGALPTVNAARIEDEVNLRDEAVLAYYKSKVKVDKTIYNKAGRLFQRRLEAETA